MFQVIKWQRVRHQLALLGCSVLALGCTTKQESSSGDNVSPGGVWMRAGTSAPKAASVELRSIAEGVEIEVQDPQGFDNGRAYTPSLAIGQTSYPGHHASPTVGGHYGLVFVVPAKEFAELAQGSPLVIHYGPPISAGKSFGTLDKGAVSQ